MAEKRSDGSSSRGFKKLVLLTLPIFVLLFLALIGYGVWRMSRGYASNHWPTASGTVISSEVKLEHKPGGLKYFPSVRYEYAVNGSTYQSSQISFDETQSKSSGPPQRVADQYEPGSEVTVHYSPHDHSFAILEPGVPTGAWLDITVGSLFLIVVCGVGAYFLRDGKRRDFASDEVSTSSGDGYAFVMPLSGKLNLFRLDNLMTVDRADTIEVTTQKRPPMFKTVISTVIVWCVASLGIAAIIVIGGYGYTYPKALALALTLMSPVALLIIATGPILYKFRYEAGPVVVADSKSVEIRGECGEAVEEQEIDSIRVLSGIVVDDRERTSNRMDKRFSQLQVVLHSGKVLPVWSVFASGSSLKTAGRELAQHLMVAYQEQQVPKEGGLRRTEIGKYTKGGIT